MKNSIKINEIPFIKPARVGNFKVWREKFRMSIQPTDEQRKKVLEESHGKKKAVTQSFFIEQINVSSLDGSWKIKIPATFEMFAMIRDLFAEHADGNKVRTAQLSAIFGNMMYVSCVANGYFQQAITYIAEIYANPKILDKKNGSHKAFMGNVKKLVDGFLTWRKEYEKHVAVNEPTEEEMRNDQTAEEMLDELEKDDEDRSNDG